MGRRVRKKRPKKERWGGAPTPAQQEAAAAGPKEPVTPEEVAAAYADVPSTRERLRRQQAVIDEALANEPDETQLFLFQGRLPAAELREYQPSRRAVEQAQLRGDDPPKGTPEVVRSYEIRLRAVNTLLRDQLLSLTGYARPVYEMISAGGAVYALFRIGVPDESLTKRQFSNPGTESMYDVLVTRGNCRELQRFGLKVETVPMPTRVAHAVFTGVYESEGPYLVDDDVLPDFDEDLVFNVPFHGSFGLQRPAMRTHGLGSSWRSRIPGFRQLVLVGDIYTRTHVEDLQEITTRLGDIVPGTFDSEGFTPEGSSTGFVRREHYLR